MSLFANAGLTRPGFNWLVAGVAVSTVTLALLGYRAIAEWQHQAQMLSERNADAAADLLASALTKDMRAVQASVLSVLHVEGALDPATLDVYQIGSAFARYPYPDAFFAARTQPAAHPMSFYTRSDRPPSWLPIRGAGDTFPVMQSTSSDLAGPLLDRIAVDAEAGRHQSCFTFHHDGRTYQVIAHLNYVDRARRRLDAIIGFMVDLDWVRANYFDGIRSQVARINGDNNGMQLAILDHRNVVVAGVTIADLAAPVRSRTFPLLFFDPLIVEIDPPRDLSRDQWTARVAVIDDRALIAARQGASRLLILVAASAFLMAAGLALAMRSEQALARLTEARSTFVSAVTHELKTPIAAIRAISETLAAGRSSHPLMTQEYAQMAVHESKRLTRLVDNLLAYSRISDVTEAYAFEETDVAVLIDQSVKTFQSQLATMQFTVTMEVEPALPPVRADRAAMALVLDNLIDNAMRYSEASRQLTITARQSGHWILITLRDRGRGIAKADLPHVRRRFFRGTGATAASGSGLGLSIADRIVGDHGGRLMIESAVGAGTTVTVSLPEAVGENDKTNFGR